MQDKIYKLLTDQHELTWQDIIYNLIKTEQLDPWDIDVSLLTKKYIETIKKMQELNFFISGKVLLAAAFLIRLKSYKLVHEDMLEFDNILFPPDVEELEDFISQETKVPYESKPLAVKTPLARKRPVTVQDLIHALERAFKVDARRRARRERWLARNDILIPEKKVNITEWIANIFKRIKEFFTLKERITFSKLSFGMEKLDKILTLYALLHLENQQKIELFQEQAFGEIDITLMEKKQLAQS